MLTHDDFELITSDELQDLLESHYYSTSFNVHDINQLIEQEAYDRNEFNAYMTITDHGYEYAIILN